MNKEKDMKFMILASLLLLNYSASASERFFSGIDYSDICKGAIAVNDGYKLECRKASQFKEIQNSFVEKKDLKNPPKVLLENLKDIVFEYQLLPDDSTDIIYSYFKKIISRSGSHVGYSVIRGAVNSEMEVKLQVFERYNLKGELVSASVRELD